MDFNANEMRAGALIKDGRYKYHVLDAREGQSQTGNGKIDLKLSLEVDGRRVVQWDKLIFTPKMFWKVEHFCKSAGMPEKIEQGRLMAEDCMGKEGYLDLIQKANNQSGVLENQVRDYMKPEAMEAKASVQGFDDDIPL